jgi:RNA polymerase primary sigma factor
LSEQLVIPEVDPEELLLERANELFAWFQQPSEDIPELSETARYRFEQLAGDADLLDVVGCIQGLEDDERLAVQLTISGFDQTLIKELVDEEALKLAIKKVRVLFNPHIAPTKSPEKPAVVPKKTVARTPRTRVATRQDSRETSERDAPFVDSTGRYLKEIGRHVLINAGVEVELSKAIEAGLFAEKILEREVKTKVRANTEELEALAQAGVEATQQFIEANLRLVVSIAKKYRRNQGELGDRIQMGNLGLIKAVEKFDYTMGYKFSTYATWWIKQSISREVANDGRTIRLPVHMEEKLYKIYTARQKLTHELDRDPTDEELTEKLGFDYSAFMEKVRSSVSITSFNKLLDADGDTELVDLVGIYHEPGYEKVDESMYVEGFRAAIESAGLTERELQVIYMRHGLSGSDGAMTLDDIGDVFGLSRERIRQVQRDAENKLHESPVFLALAQDMNFKPDGAAKTTKTEKPLGVRERAKFELAARLAENDTVLTEMEHYVARAVIEEKNQADAAKRLKLSAPTVTKVMRGVRAKLNLQ